VATTATSNGVTGPDMSSLAQTATISTANPRHRSLYVQVLIAILLGVVVGWLWPQFATNDWVKALGDAFIRLIKMVIAPVVFCTVVSGIAHVDDTRKVGRVGLKALLYFEVISTAALLIGLIAGNLFPVGHGLAARPDAAAVATYAKQADAVKAVDVVLNIIPDSVVGALARGDMLQVLLFAVLFGFSLQALGERGARLRGLIDDSAHAVFGIIAIVLRAAPFGAFGAMAFTIGRYGPAALGNLVGLIALMYAAVAVFVVVVLGLVAWIAGFSIFKYLAYIKDEILIVLGTSTSESVLPQLMEKLERLGCSKSVVGLVVPTGYSFNLDGTNIYMTLATLFIAQALGVDLTLNQQLTILVVAMLTSKGAGSFTGGGFIVLAATLPVVNPALVPGMAIIFSIDRFMSEARSLTNMIGNGVAAVVVSWWEGELDHAQLRAALGRGGEPAELRRAVAAE
jgi:aerobic C4-dicarboxylate transport protein